MAEVLNAVVVGASSGVGRAIAERLSGLGAHVILASRSFEDLTCLASHLELTTQGTATAIEYDLTSGSAGAVDFCSACVAELGRIDAIFLTAATVDDRDRGLTPGDTARQLVEVDLLGPIHTLAEFAKVFEKQGNGTMVVFSSIAASAPRKNNTVYAAAKTGMEAYCKGLRHYLAPRGVRVQIYRLGYVDTAMAAGRTRLFPKVRPTSVAKHVIGRLRGDFGLSYYPRYWRVVGLLLRITPWAVFRRLDI